MNKNSYLRKRVLNIKSQVVQWAKQERIKVDVNEQTFYLLNHKNDACRMLPSHINKLIRRCVEQGLLQQPKTQREFSTLYCDGIVISEALLSCAQITPRWVDVKNVSMAPSFSMASGA